MRPRTTAAAHYLHELTQATWMRITAAGISSRPSRGRADRGRLAKERGDVPGWVMITMMTAIVVIVLLGVFQDAVVNAVQNAFDSISGAGDSGGTGTP